MAEILVPSRRIPRKAPYRFHIRKHKAKTRRAESPDPSHDATSTYESKAVFLVQPQTVIHLGARLRPFVVTATGIPSGSLKTLRDTEPLPQCHYLLRQQRHPSPGFFPGGRTH